MSGITETLVLISIHTLTALCILFIGACMITLAIDESMKIVKRIIRRIK